MGVSQKKKAEELASQPQQEPQTEPQTYRGLFRGGSLYTDRLEGAKRYREKQELTKKLEREQHEREEAARQAAKKPRTEEIADLQNELKSFVAKIEPGSIYATGQIVNALNTLIEIVDFLLEDKHESDTSSQNEVEKP